MTGRDECDFSPDNVVIYCSSVQGGYSWALTDSTDLAVVRGACKAAAEGMGATLVCCTLRGLVSADSGNDDIDEHWTGFMASIKNDEYEQFESVSSEDLDAAVLLGTKRGNLLCDLLQIFFDTGYITDFDQHLSPQGVSVIFQGEG